MGNADDLAGAYINLVHILGFANRLDEAVRVAHEGLESLARLGLERHSGGFLRANAAESLLKAGRWDEAEQLLATALARGRGLRMFRVLLQSARLATWRGDYDQAAGRYAAASWAAAAAAWTELGRPYPAAYASWREADARLAVETAKDKGVLALRRAFEQANALGARPLLERVRLLAGWHRIPLEAPVADEPRQEQPSFGLTARELEVLDGLVYGRTNRQIAETLFISTKTVSVHVSNILGKLHVSKREEAARVAYRSGLIPLR